MARAEERANDVVEEVFLLAVWHNSRSTEGHTTEFLEARKTLDARLSIEKIAARRVDDLEIATTTNRTNITVIREKAAQTCEFDTTRHIEVLECGHVRETIDALEILTRPEKEFS